MSDINQFLKKEPSLRFTISVVFGIAFLFFVGYTAGKAYYYCR
jgi:hypothetical protein